MKKTKLLIFVMIVSLGTIFAQDNWQSKGDMNWNETDGWFSITTTPPGSGNPAAADNVTITSGHSVVVTADATVHNLDVNGILNLNEGVTLTIKGDFHIYDVVIIGDGNLNVHGDVINDGNFIGKANGNVNIQGDFTNNGTAEFYEEKFVVKGTTSGAPVIWKKIPAVPLSSWSIVISIMLIIGYRVIRKI